MFVDLIKDKFLSGSIVIYSHYLKKKIVFLQVLVVLKNTLREGRNIYIDGFVDSDGMEELKGRLEVLSWIR